MLERMAGTKAKFKVQWTRKATTTYPVPGKTYDDMFEFFRKKNAAKEEWGRFSPEKPGISFGQRKDGTIADVVLMVGYTITVPKWGGLGSASKTGKDAWTKMAKALDKHEEKHRKILEDLCEDFGTAVTKEDPLTKEKLDVLFGAFPAAVKKAQDEFDVRTGNGKKEGVFLPAPDEVEGK